MAGPGTKRDLLRIMARLAQWDEADVAALEADLMRQATQAWHTALREKGEQYAGAALTTRDPRGNDLRRLRKTAKRIARQVAEAWNRGVEKELARLYKANPRGNRHYYARALGDWMTARQQSSAPVIANDIVQSTRDYAKDRFLTQNGIAVTGLRLVGPPPVCDVCIDLMGRGVVPREVARRQPMPAHPRCNHEWEEVTRQRRLRRGSIWLGG